MTRQAIIVLGMHRSGTSAVAGALGLAGLQLPGEALPAKDDNPRGFFEPARIVALNDRALRLVGTQWYGLDTIQPGAFVGEQSDKLVNRLIEALDEEYPEAATLVLKDPRLCRLLPLWRQVFAKAGIGWRAVLPLRDAYEVAGSLRSRQGFPIEFGLALWLRHVLDAEAQSRGTGRLFVRYDEFLAEPAAIVSRIGSTLVEGWRGVDAALEATLRGFVDPALNQQGARRRPQRQSPFATWLTETDAAHRRLFANPEDRDACDALDRVRSAFDSDIEGFAPLFTEMAGAINKLTAAARGEAPPPGWQRSLGRLARTSLRRLFESGRA